MSDEELCRHYLVLRDCADCRPRHPVTTRGTGAGWAGTDRYLPGPEPVSHDWNAVTRMADTDGRDAHALGPWIYAKYNGHCRGCGDPWEPGDRIRFSEDENGWLCSDCGSDDD